VSSSAAEVRLLSKAASSSPAVVGGNPWQSTEESRLPINISQLSVLLLSSALESQATQGLHLALVHSPFDIWSLLFQLIPFARQLSWPMRFSAGTRFHTL